MRISGAYPSQYLKAADLQGKRVKITMSHVTMEDVGGEPKPILHFMGTDKGLVLNKTNANNIAIVYGDETETWQGQVIELFEAMVDFQGRTVAAIRVHVPRQAAPAARAQQPAQTAPIQAPPVLNGMPAKPSAMPVGLDDEIPF